MSAVNYALLGVGHVEGEEVGLLGKVAAVHWNSEEQHRGSLHWHGLLWLADKPDPRDFALLLESPDFQKRVFAYLDSIILQQPPAMCRNGAFANPNASTVDPEAFQSPLKKARSDDHPSLNRPADPQRFDSDSAWLDYVAKDLNVLVPLVQTHVRQHTHTCHKPAMLRPKLIDEEEANKQARALSDEPNPRVCTTCRFHFPRILQEETRFDNDGELQLERRHHWTNCYSPMLTHCIRSNSDIRSLWGNSVDSLAAMFYVTNYVSKVKKRTPLQLCTDCPSLFAQMQSKLSSKVEVMHIAQQRVQATVDQTKSEAADPDAKENKFSAEARIAKQFCSSLFNLLQVKVS